MFHLYQLTAEPLVVVHVFAFNPHSASLEFRARSATQVILFELQLQVSCLHVDCVRFYFDTDWFVILNEGFLLPVEVRLKVLCLSEYYLVYNLQAAAFLNNGDSVVNSLSS